MIKRLLVVAVAAVTLAGCANESMSGDVYSSSQAKQVQNVTYGTLVSVRPVKIQGGEGSNALGMIGGAVIGGLLGNTVGGGTGRTLATAAAPSPAARRATASVKWPAVPQATSWKSKPTRKRTSWWYRKRATPSSAQDSACAWRAWATPSPSLRCKSVGDKRQTGGNRLRFYF